MLLCELRCEGNHGLLTRRDVPGYVPDHRVPALPPPLPGLPPPPAPLPTLSAPADIRDRPLFDVPPASPPPGSGRWGRHARGRGQGTGDRDGAGGSQGEGRPARLNALLLMCVCRVKGRSGFDVLCTSSHSSWVIV